MSVEGQDERAKIEAAWDAQEHGYAYEGLGGREKQLVEAGYRAALVEAEARERELDALKRMMPDESSVLVSVVDLEAVGRRAEKAEAELAVLVKALKFYAEDDRYAYDVDACWGTYISKKRRAELDAQGPNEAVGVLEDDGALARAALDEVE